MDNRKFIEYLRICGRINQIEENYTEALIKLDLDLRKAWHMIEMMDSNVSTIYIMGSVLSISLIYNKSSYKDNINLSDFFKEYVKTFKLKDKYIGKTGSKVLRFHREAAFLDNRYLDSFDDLRIVHDENFSGINVRLNEEKLRFINFQYKDGLLKIGYDEEHVGGAVLIKDNECKILDINEVKDYIDIIKVLIDDENYDIALLSYISDSMKFKILKCAVKGLELNNDILVRVIKILGIYNERVTDKSNALLGIRKSKVDISRFIGILLDEHYLTLPRILEMGLELSDKQDADQEKIDRFIDIIECYVKNIKLADTKRLMEVFHKENLENMIKLFGNLKIKDIQELRENDLTYKFKDYGVMGIRFKEVNRKAKDIVQSRGKKIGIDNLGKLHFNTKEYYTVEIGW